MGSSSNPLDLTLSLKPSYVVPKSLNCLLSDLAQIDSVSRKLSVLKDYLKQYEEEYRRIEPLRRELPQCMLILMDAIQVIREQILVLEKNSVKFDHRTVPFNCDRQIQPEKRCFPPSMHGRDTISMIQFPNKFNRNGKQKAEAITTRWSDPMSKSNINVNNYSTTPILNSNYSYLSESTLINNRRCWTNELHKRFLKALNDIGSSEAATPKKVRDMMQVEGITISQVKSHLQKVRICKRAGVRLVFPGAEEAADPAMTASTEIPVSPLPLPLFEKM